MNRRRLLVALASAATAIPAALRAQQKPMPVIGFLTGGSLSPRDAALAAFVQGLSETGYIDGRNVAIEYRMAGGSADRLSTLAADLVGHKVDVIVASGDAAVLAARNATSTIPIVFDRSGDPVEAGLVTSFARPGGNLTGISFMIAELLPKRLELLSELAPQAKVFALLVNPNWPNAEPMVHQTLDAARSKGLQLQILKAGSESEIDAAFANLVRLHVDALVVSPNQFFFQRQEQLVALAARDAVPAIYAWREFAAAGGLISYGPSVTGGFRLSGIYVGRILNGAKPADLPVQQPTTFELVVNLKTAKALSLTIPPSILARADEVIE